MLDDEGYRERLAKAPRFSRGTSCLTERPHGRILTTPTRAAVPRPQYVARPRWSGTFLSLSTSYAAADRDGPRSGGGGFKKRPTRTTIRRLIRASEARKGVPQSGRIITR